MRTVKSAILTQINQPLEIDELTIPELKRGQVLVKIAYSGVCHSQLNELRGLKGEDKFLPHCLGHEGSGIVAEIGPGVLKVKPNDHVVLTWIKGNGLEAPSTQYQRPDGTVVNAGPISTFMEYAIVSENRIVSMPKEMPFKEAALLGCAIPTGAGVVLNTAQIQRGASVAIFGVGGIGSGSILAARMVDAAIIIAVDIHEHKLLKAKEMGATHSINASYEDTLARIDKITDGKGVDYAIEAAGQSAAMEAAFKCVKDKGGLCILAGNLPAGQKIQIDPFDLIKGKQIAGTWGGEANPDRDIWNYVNMYLTGKLKLETMAPKVYALGEINDAMNYLEGGDALRILVDMTYATL
jgi:S-(hydroxymethyl)glutathione dehydrogenase/alcohol dehydrogenase